MSTIKVNNLTAPADNNFAIEMETGENMRVAGGMTNNYWTQFSIPSGTTSERPSAPVAGMLRFNTQTQYLEVYTGCLLYTSPSPRDGLLSRMPSSA